MKPVFKKIITPSVWRNTLDVILGKKIIAYWWRGKNNKNWGDKINPLMVEALSDKKVIHVDDVFNFRFLKVYANVGSIIHLLRFKNVHIWGSGLIQDDLKVNIKTGNIHAVRGPLTREVLMKKGLHCPEVYGDPVLLLPEIYSPKCKKSIELCIIPHFVDQNDKEIKRLEMEGGFIIDIFDDELELVKKVNRCKRIVSSSLHGLILADAYGIPSKWIKISDKIFGNDFKFKDYYASIGVHNEKPLVLSQELKLSDLKSSCRSKTMSINKNDLLSACPFYNGKKSGNRFSNNF